ncbi:hypothetical protein [Paraburkholderia tropica]|uniref:hypothetical protein n=1 Tax=Paraburkholderia tropica TaxID=92647 RepID=UPI0007ECBCF6|nr:hypothetical protein [Paraburkholderia tropica]OBR53971.1 hypothetical protein A6456_21800 [Paraburkholderia tropica]
MKKSTKSIAAAIVGSLLATACSSSKDANEENLSTAISASFQKHGVLCFSYIPGADTVGDDDNSDYANEQRALVKAGLLSAKSVTDYRHRPAHEFDISGKGRTILQNGQFCFAKAALDKVVKWDNVKKVDGLDASSTFVYYTYKLTNVPEWATTQELQASQPTMRAAFSGANGHTVMRASVTRMGDHWSLDNFGNPVSGAGL